jgi:hypothetical protein
VNLDISSSLSIGTLVVLAGKWYHDHMTIKEMKVSEQKLNKQISHVETENIKIIEALERTYVSKEYIFKYFFSRKDIEVKFKHLESTISSELSHMSLSIERLTKSLENK